MDFTQIEALLKKAVALDPKLAEAHLQLGNLYSDQTQYAEAIPEYLMALDSDSEIRRRALPPGPGLRAHRPKGQSASPACAVPGAARATPGRS